MNAIIESYGKALISCVISAIILSFVLLLTKSYYEQVYPDHNQSSIVTTYENTLEQCGPPVLKVSNEIKIKRGNTDYDAKSYCADKTNENYIKAWNNYRALATAYASDLDSTELQVDVYGFDEIDVNNVGHVYMLLFKATNANGHTTTKKVYVLIN